MWIPFNKPYITGKEQQYLAQVQADRQLSGDGAFTKRCSAWLEAHVGCERALLTHSCTAALEMAAILSDIHLGDEVIMPSYTFASTANAFILRGAVPVFVDVRSDTLNIDEAKIEEAITEKTKAIVPVHYAGVACEMDTIMEIAAEHRLLVIEDAAQGVMAGYKGRPLGSMGHMAAVSFHESKNIVSGEGGALLVNDSRLVARSEIIREKGTNRSSFLRGEVDKYTWVDIGSSYLPSELNAAFLLAQFEQAADITGNRLELWNTYHKAMASFEKQGKVRRPIIPDGCSHNAHIYYLLLPDAEQREGLLSHLKGEGVGATFHYVPLHSAPAGKRYGRTYGEMAVTDALSSRIVRLPLWVDMGEDVVYVIDQLAAWLTLQDLIPCSEEPPYDHTAN